MEKTFREVIADIKPGEVWESDCKTITIDKVGDIGIKTKFKSSNLMRFSNDTLYKLKQKPVTFDEVLNSVERCRVEHELLKGISEFKDYWSFAVLMEKLSQRFYSTAFREIIKEGKWYLEE